MAFCKGQAWANQSALIIFRILRFLNDFHLFVMKRIFGSGKFRAILNSHATNLQSFLNQVVQENGFTSSWFSDNYSVCLHHIFFLKIGKVYFYLKTHSNPDTLNF